jgi:predicted nucleic acid-binding protein
LKLVVDTSVLIDHLRGEKKAVRLLSEAVSRDDELWSSTLVRTEILAGMRESERSATMRLLETVTWLDVTIAVADRAGALAKKYLKSHAGVDTVDYVLAATAEELNASLCTLNVKHFPMFKDLRPAY